MPLRQASIGEFFDHPDDYSIPQLWEKFQNFDLENDNDGFGVTSSVIVDAIERYYLRSFAERETVDTRVKFAARLLHGQILLQSKWYKQYQSQLKRAHNIILFEAVELGW